MSASLSPAIAIIGMACEFPGAHSPSDLWHNVLAQRRYFRKAPRERLAAEYIAPDQTAEDKSYCDLMAVLEGWHFDPVAFGIAPVTMQVSDMAHWLALHTARAALRDASLDLSRTDRTRMGIVLGNTLAGEFARSHLLRHRWPYVERALRDALAQRVYANVDADDLVLALRQHYLAPLPAITEDSLAGNMANTIAGRICSYFDLGGGGYVVDGACSSSLLSIAHACNALASEELDVIIAGGVDISLDPFEIIGFAKTKALARDDIRPYDERAAGMLPGEGCGMFVLMREAQARTAGHQIHALIRGWGISSDGTGSITAPGIEGQMRALQIAYRRAGYPLSSVGLIEGHGTGTALGDKVEITALRQILEGQAVPGSCRIGSIKGQIGHCKAAAGSAGMIKAVLALQRKIYPPTGNCSDPSTAFGTPIKSLRPQLHGQAWPSGTTPRRAAVSAMGFGGANAHITLEEANPDDQAMPTELAMLGTAQMTELILLSAAGLGQLRQRIALLLSISERICRADLTDLAAALAMQATAGSERLAIVAASPWELAGTLRHVLHQLDHGTSLAELNNPQHHVFSAQSRKQPKFVALFPGQGSQYLNMGQHLLRRFPFSRELHDTVDPRLINCVYKDMLDADDASHKRWQQDLRATEIAQPAITLHAMMMLQVLQHFGLQPDIAIGHSLGEISALAAAGAWDANTALHLATARGNAIASLPLIDCGGMLALAATPGQTSKLIALAQADVQIANFNSPHQTVASGDSQSIARLLHLCQQQGVPSRQLQVSHAFHSKLVAPAAALMPSIDTRWEQFDSNRKTTFISTSSNEPVTTATDLSKLLREQIGKPVRFTQAVQLADQQHPDLWIEVGPGKVLTRLVCEILDQSTPVAMPTDDAGEDGFDLLNRVLAAAFVCGFPVATEKLFAHRFHRPFDIDGYDPLFIVNPCESKIANRARPPESSTRLPEHTNTAQSHLLPAAMSELVPSQKSAPADSISPGDHATLFSYAASWIAERTGFPLEVIGPQTKLRDHLNLDSIKVGELLVQMAQKSRQPLRVDPLPLSNASLGQLVDAFLQAPQAPLVTATNAVPEAASINQLQWVDTFQIISIAAPIDAEPLHSPRRSAPIILTGETSERTTAIIESLLQLGLSPQRRNIAEFPHGSDALNGIDAFLLVLPARHKPLFSCTLAESIQRVEADASALYQFFHRILANRQNDARPIRGLVLRPLSEDTDGTADSDAGAAFVKTLTLEQPELAIKWIALPEAWSPRQWARTIALELQCAGRPAIHYTPDGARMTAVARAMPAADHPSAPLPDPLVATDVLLVSGGAKGITFELAIDLARRTKVRLALLGSSARKDAGEEARANFIRLDNAGLQYCYLQADVVDRAAVLEAVKLAEHALGPVTAILHGAGVSAIRPLRDKPLAEYLHCIRVKACGLLNLISAVTTNKLKALHVISSVLGNTGMHGQIDYTFANAWLNSAVRAFKSSHPRTQCLSLGYSVWSDIGLGQRLGVVDTLHAAGVTAIAPAQGVAAYRRLSSAAQDATQFVITGRLGTTMEEQLFGALPIPRPRFLEKIMTWIPGKEVVAQSQLSHASDPYLAEHVFDGSPLLPAVMSIEAILQIAQTCASSTALPVLRNVQLRRPVLVPEGSTVTLQLQAFMEATEDGSVCVQVNLRTDIDNFQRNFVEATCWFGLPDATTENLPICPMLPLPLATDPEVFCPSPLFQGKFFRRIASVRILEMEKQSLTDIRIPAMTDYYHGPWSKIPASPYPAIRDAALQSGAISLPPGFLPVSLGELRFHKTATEKLICHVQITKRTASHYICNIALFDVDGVLLETMQDLMLRAPRRIDQLPVQVPCPISFDHVTATLEALLPNRPHAFSYVQHQGASAPETASANLASARRAASQFIAQHHLQKAPPPECITLHHRADGKPILHGDFLPAALDITISHAAGISITLLASPPIGIDLEPLACRDYETWLGLLGKDGYAFALNIQRVTGESFDCAATRVWTILEATCKTGLTHPTLARLSISPQVINQPLLIKDGNLCEYACLLVKHPTENGLVLALTVSMAKSMGLNDTTQHDDSYEQQPVSAALSTRS